MVCKIVVVVMIMNGKCVGAAFGDVGRGSSVGSVWWVMVGWLVVSSSQTTSGPTHHECLFM